MTNLEVAHKLFPEMPFRRIVVNKCPDSIGLDNPEPIEHYGRRACPCSCEECWLVIARVKGVDVIAVNQDGTYQLETDCDCIEYLNKE